MDSRRCLKIADRIDALLEKELGQGVDLERMLRDHLYRRDVLLVCDAFPGHALAALAQDFRAALADDEPPPAAAASGTPSRPGAEPVPSRPGFISSLFGALRS